MADNYANPLAEAETDISKATKAITGLLDPKQEAQPEQQEQQNSPEPTEQESSTEDQPEEQEKMEAESQEEATEEVSQDEEYIAVGNGAAELIDQITDVIDGNFGLYSPTFEEYTSRFKNTDVRVPDKKGFKYGKSEVIDLVSNNDGVILINPDNPSGNFIEYTDIKEILYDFKSKGKYLILDESFLDFAEGGFDSSTLNAADLEEFPNLIVIKSIGKSYGVGGLRLGVLATSNKDLISKIKINLPIWNINSVAEFYLQIIGKYEKQYVESCKKLIHARSILFNELKEVKYIEPYSSQANYIFCRLINKNAHKLASDLCSKYSILIKDCSGKEGIDNQYIRVAVRDSYDNEYLIKSLKAL